MNESEQLRGELLRFPDMRPKEVIDREHAQNFPRRLHMRLEVYAEAQGDEAVCLPVADAIALIAREPAAGLRDGVLRSGTTFHFQDPRVAVRVRVTWRNDCGTGWWNRLRYFWREHRWSLIPRWWP